MDNVTISSGFPEANRAKAATLFLEAFGPKLRAILGQDHRIHAFISDVMDPNQAICATAPDGTLLGIAGFKTKSGGFVGGELKDVARHCGWVTAIPRGRILSLLERQTTPNSLLMDGICVDATARGTGIGSRLLDAIIDRARHLGAASVRLDDIDENPRAKALYLRKGFQEAGKNTLGPLRHVLSFSAATTMRLALTQAGGIDATVFNTNGK